MVEHVVEIGLVLVDEGTFEFGFRVGVRVPRLLLDDEGGFGQERLEPARQMGAHVVNFVSVLARTSGTVFVGFIDENFHSGFFALQKREMIFLPIFLYVILFLL